MKVFLFSKAHLTIPIQVKKDQLRLLDFRLRDPVRNCLNLETIQKVSCRNNPQVENGHLFRLKTFTDRVVESRKAKEIMHKIILSLSITAQLSFSSYQGRTKEV